MKIDTLKNFVKQGIKNAYANGTMSAASIVAIIAALSVLGMVMVAVLNLNYMVDGLESKVEVSVFLQDDVTYGDVITLKDDIKAWQGVTDVEFISKEQALKKWKEEWEDKKYLLEGYSGDNNPLPPSLNIRIAKPEYAEEVVKKAEGLEKSVKVRYSKAAVDAIEKLSGATRLVGSIIVLVLILISVIIITNTIKLTVYARRREINIMKYIGATDWYIRWPFVIEGFTIGVTGGIMGTLLIALLYNILLNKLTVMEGQPNFLDIFRLLPLNGIISQVFAVFVLVGAAVGILSSIVSMRRYLRV
ncbi:MAG: permease-like cell division protein FtsX [Xylanivirga thermophila]|uniref:permease-like cell division protein FtsX n=1 Tax=Xylanivirga thermophila TaxID=2496273 RepID=UPI0013EE1C7A|nr:permease-like cell division protein FtsX [Xylanivirga thermophila]